MNILLDLHENLHSGIPNWRLGLDMGVSSIY